MSARGAMGDAIASALVAGLAEARVEQGSWWPEWLRWLEQRSTGRKVATPPLGAPDKGYGVLCAAPGTYVLKK